MTCADFCNILIFVLQWIVKQTLLNSLWPSDAIWQHRSGSSFFLFKHCLGLILVNTGLIIAIKKKKFLSSGAIDAHWLGHFALRPQQTAHKGPKEPKSCLRRITKTFGLAFMIRKSHESPVAIDVHCLVVLPSDQNNWPKRTGKGLKFCPESLD